MKKRKDGRYQLSVMIGYNPDGKPKRKVVYGNTQKEVKDKAYELRMLHNMGIELDSDITVAEWAVTWFSTYKTGVSYNTRLMYQRVIDTYILPNLGHYKLKDIKAAHLQKIANEHSKKGRTMEIFKLTLSQMFAQAVINDILVKNPVDGLRLPNVVKKHEKRALTSDEVSRIISLDLDKKTKCFVMLLLYTGMRRGEALAITKDDICFKNMEISVNKSLFFKKNQSEIKHNPKTEAGIRVIPLLDPLKPVLHDYLETIPSGYLFTNQNGSTMSLSAYRYMWGQFEKALGSKAITAHIFRHNFATMLYNAEIDVKAAQVILGHKSISVTMDIYTHLSNRHKVVAAQKLNNFLASDTD